MAEENSFWSGITDFFEPIGDWFSDLFTSDSYDAFVNGSSNKVNQEIAETNLGYQKERNAIEDTRYAEERDFNRAFANEEQAWQRAFANEEQAWQRAWANEEQAYNRMFANEEQAYNRAFAKEQQEYERALQDKIFEREDTALERQAQSLSAMGINPLSVNMNGLGAGQAIQSSLSPVATSGSSPSSSSVSPRGSSAPNSSNRGGQALFNRFQRQSAGALSVIAPLQQLARTIQDFQAGNIQRDNLALQNDRMYLENLELANDLGFDNYTVPRRDSTTNKENRKRYGLFTFNPENQEGKFSFSRNYKNYKKANEIRNIEHDTKNRIFNSDPDLLKNMKVFANEDYYKILEDALTNGSKLGDMFLKLLK